MLERLDPVEEADTLELINTVNQSNSLIEMRLFIE